MNEKDFYQKNGYIIIKNLIPHDAIDNYKQYWTSINAPNYNGTVNSMLSKNGWKQSNPFMEHEEILPLLCHDSIYEVFSKLGLEKMILHLAFTGWVSTQKAWHHDYIVGSQVDKVSAENYAGLWIALEDISPKSGPFAFVPGSHLWNTDIHIYYKKDPQEVISYLEKEIQKNNGEPQVFLPQKGDALLWQGHTLHMALTPEDQNTPRESIIAHYFSGVNGFYGLERI